MSPPGRSRVPPRVPGKPAEIPVVQAKKVAPPEVHWPQRLRPAQAKLPTVAPPSVPQQKSVAPPPVCLPRQQVTSTALQPRKAPSLVLQPAAVKVKPKKMTLAELQKWAESQKKSEPPAKKAWAAVAGAAAGAPMAAAAPPVMPTRFGADCTALDWSNARIGQLVALAARPARFWAGGLVDGGATAATHYWSFNALWVLQGAVRAADGLLYSTVAGQNAEYVDGTLQLHYHPHAKPTDNYLHIKKSDGSDPGAGAFKNNHWLVAAIGLTAAALTPDGV